MSETPEQTAALDALEDKIDSLSPEDRAKLETYLETHLVQPTTATEAVALIPEIEKAIHIVAPHTAPIASPARPAHQTVGASLPLQGLER